MKYRIEGNQKLEGKIFINGSKNAALAILVGAILSKNQVILHNLLYNECILKFLLNLEHLKDLVCYEG